MHVDERILVVDSDMATRARLQSMLTAHGYTVVQADGLAAAPAALGQAAWVFVIVGYQLDDGSGLDLLDVAREHAPGAAIILIGDRQQATALSALRHGADDYLPTPIYEADLLAALQRAARAARTRQVVCPRQVLPLAGDQSQASPVTQQDLAALVHEISNPLTPIIGLAEMLLEDLPPDHPGREYATSIKAAAWRIRDVVRRLRAAPGSTGGDGMIRP